MQRIVIGPVALACRSHAAALALAACMMAPEPIQAAQTKLMAAKPGAAEPWDQASIAFRLLEKVLVALWKGKPVMDSIGANSLLEMLILGVIMFVVLMPFFALIEIARDVGGDRLFEQFFLRRSQSIQPHS